MTASLAIQVRKEARALLPWWLCVAVTTIMIGMLPPRIWSFPDYRHNPETWSWVVMVYALGILAVAAFRASRRDDTVVVPEARPVPPKPATV